MSRRRTLYDGTPVMAARPLVVGLALSVPLWGLIMALRWAA